MQRANVMIVVSCPLVFLCGCGQSDAQVSHVTGTVVLLDRPVEIGKIAFFPKDETWNNFHGVIRDGKFDVVPMERYGQGRAGIYRVVITTMPVKPPPRDSARAHPPLPRKPGQPPLDSSFPAKYQNKNETPFVFDLRPGVNELGTVALSE